VAARGDPGDAAEQRTGRKAGAELAVQDGLRGVSDCLDLVVDIKETNDPARASFETFVAPRESADHATFAQHHLDVAAEILSVQQTLLERPIVEGKHVRRNLSAGLLVLVFERPEKLAGRLAVLLGELL